MRTLLKVLAVTSAVLAAGASESGSGEVPLCGGLQILQPRLPPGAVVGAWKLGIRTDAVAGLWKPGIRRGLWDGGRGGERGYKCRSRGCGRRRRARHRERCRHGHLQYAFGALASEAWEPPPARPASIAGIASGSSRLFLVARNEAGGDTRRS
jgi:hypothetical protein